MYAAPGKDKVAEKARAAVKNSSEGDWKTYALSAQMVIERKIALNEAKEWLEESLNVKETPFNLEIMGDYYMAAGQAKEAMTYYFKSMNLLKETTVEPNTDAIQQKLWDARAVSLQ